MSLRTRCSACGARIPGKDPSAFLCLDCVRLVPLPLMLRYQRACRSVLAYRRSIGRRIDPTPHRLNIELAASWRLAADAARAAHAAQREPTG